MFPYVGLRRGDAALLGEQSEARKTKIIPAAACARHRRPSSPRAARPQAVGRACQAAKRNPNQVSAWKSFWWGRKDSNLRSHEAADLQSAPFATRDTPPFILHRALG